MRTVVAGPWPAELEAFLQRRHQLGQDGFDEIWAGDYHVAPMAHFFHGRMTEQLVRRLGPHADRAGLLGSGPFNLGVPGDFRVPDGGYHRALLDTAWLPTAAIVVEVVSPGDETWDKLDFYFAHDVDELLIVDPATRALTWLARSGAHFVEVDGSRLLQISTTELAAQLDWPRASSA